MDRDPLDLDYPRLLLAALTIVTVIALAVAGSTSAVAFGAYNPAWDGASDLRAVADDVGAEGELVRNTTAYRQVPANGTVAVILSPDRPYDSAEAERVREFVAGGGTLVVAEDFGSNANPLLRSIGASARVNGSLLRDERYHYRTPAMPIARNVSANSVVSNGSSLTLNHGTAVEPNGATVLVTTSGYAYLDRNRNEKVDSNETLDAYPVATVERVGAGRVVVLGDPSALINAMLEQPGNRAVVRSLFSAHERVLLDYSHAERLPPLALALLVVRESALVQLVLGGAAIGLVGLWNRAPGLTDRLRARRGRGAGEQPPRPDEQQLAAIVRRRHPDWDADRVNRVIKGIITHGDDSRRDE